MAFAKKQFTLAGNQLKTPSPKKNSYRTKTYTSEVDETLFGIPTRYTQQIETKHMHDEKDWDPPWATGPTKKGAPLLWTPFTIDNFQDSSNSLAKSEIHRSCSKPSTPRSARHANKYRLKSQTPYVDETLFGSKKLIGPNLKTQWDNNENFDGLKQIWSPGSYDVKSPRFDNAYDDRPGSRLGEYNDPYIPPTPRDRTGSCNISTPVIKYRSGSNIKTSSAGLQASNKFIKNSKLKLDFNEEDKSEKEELIERALRLARQAQEAAVNSGYNSNRKQAWSRPSSTSGNSPRISGRKSRRFSDFVDFDNLSATGVRIPLSARESESGSRPNSARLPSRSSQRPHSARLSDDKPNWKP